MGCEYKVTCRACGHKSLVNDGGGFLCHMLRCDKCGREKDVGFNEMGEIHLRYIKGLSGPYCVATTKFDKTIRENYRGKPLSERKYNKAVENFADKCGCGGQFKLKAKLRCPKCKSARLKKGAPTFFYD